MQINVYLSGPMSGLTLKQAKSWRNSIINKTHWKAHKSFIFLDPLRHHEAENDSVVIDASPEFFSHLKPPANLFSSDKAMFNRDLTDVKRADCVIVDLRVKENSIGTVAEIAWAHLLGKPIIAIHQQGGIKHPFLREMTTYSVDNETQAVEVLLALFPGRQILD